ncbi:MAG: Asp-tRNA(Asn)/Glu-tRNA(Gln) amidotransferase subunit GatC [Actinomycetota bacterium]
MPEPTDPPPAPEGREPLTRADVEKVASLALLELTDQELDTFTDQLDAVLDLAGRLEAFDVADVPPTAHPFGLTNVFRADQPEPAADAEAMRQEALAGGPEVEGDRYRVPPALGEAP